MRPSWKTGLFAATLLTTLILVGQYTSSAGAQATETPTLTPFGIDTATDTTSDFPTNTPTPTLSPADLTAAVRQATATSRPANLKDPAATAFALFPNGEL